MHLNISGLIIALCVFVPPVYMLFPALHSGLKRIAAHFNEGKCTTESYKKMSETLSKRVTIIFFADILFLALLALIFRSNVVFPNLIHLLFMLPRIARFVRFDLTEAIMQQYKTDLLNGKG